MEVVNLSHQNAFNVEHQNGLLLDRDLVVSTFDHRWREINKIGLIL